MTRFTHLLGIALISAAVSAEPQPRNVPKAEQQPGTIRLSGIHDSDRVLLDGELVGNGKRLAQFGSKLLVNPGEYTVTIVSSNDEACEMRVAVRENRTALASCSAPTDDEFVD